MCACQANKPHYGNGEQLHCCTTSIIWVASHFSVKFGCHGFGATMQRHNQVTLLYHTITSHYYIKLPYHTAVSHCGIVPYQSASCHPLHHPPKSVLRRRRCPRAGFRRGPNVRFSAGIAAQQAEPCPPCTPRRSAVHSAI